MLYFQTDGVEITVYQSTFGSAALVRAIARICVPLEQENRVTVTVVSATRSILLVRLNPRDSGTRERKRKSAGRTGVANRVEILVVVQ
jgi:hypothetical protein